jgi:hypothetical protein
VFEKGTRKRRGKKGSLMKKFFPSDVNMRYKNMTGKNLINFEVCILYFTMYWKEFFSLRLSGFYLCVTGEQH